MINQGASSMHSTIVSLTYVTFLFVEVVGLGSSRTVEAVILAASVAFIGVPHGAFDHVVGQRILQPILGNFWSPVFFTSYLAIAACVVMGWYLWPVGTVLAFFLVSAWHFGIEDREMSQRDWFSHAQAVASGGLIIWLPAFIRQRDVIEILNLVIPDGHQGVGVTCATITAGSAIVLAPLVLLNAIKSLNDVIKPELSFASLLSSEFFRTFALTVLCVSVSPLISFTVYFCGWHSIRGLIRIAATLTDHPLILALKLAPLTIMAIGLAVAGSSVWSSTQTLTPSLIRTVFIVLNALAVPHLFLHVSDAMISRERAAATF
jgi:beta-carotene 15,15'-dioxygenase